MYTLKDAEDKITENRKMFRKWISETSIDGNDESVNIYHNENEYIVSLDENNHIFEILQWKPSDEIYHGKQVWKLDYDNPIPESEYSDYYLDLACAAVAWRDDKVA